ncbi:branched-chain amino acid transporter permease [Acetivibrio ethanolgignens]|uniref:Branched-chain amino acid transporter AzlD n=1 Tax=Acetivibrio ethanolgignens TaxID=290052 RepID=A0A0V8QB69_9FIRM|nr:AzlD domain-containing protein [Acetivibrio ethanolgignens]KSV57783.1 branched-chain amino acid transporter AzlD [Acetivibrio ethanolgignens]
MSIKLYPVICIVIIAFVTMILRFLPFILLGNEKKTPKSINYLGKVLPYAIMGMLVVYCLKGIRITKYPYGIPEVVSCIIVAGIHIWKRNTLLSIMAGTVFYMILIQSVF